MKNRNLGTDLSVFPVGLGCMGMSHGYGGQEEGDAIRTLHRAVELGVTLFDTAEVYGPFANEVLVGKGLAPFRDKVKIATKFGFRIEETPDGPKQVPGLNSQPRHVRAVAEASLRRMGIETIDLYYQHRVDPDVPIEETVGAMAELVARGQGAQSRPLRGRRGHHPPGACGASDRRRAERILAVDSRSGERRARHLPRARHRLRAVQPARPRLPGRRHHLGRPARREGFSARPAALRAGEYRQEPRGGGEAEAACGGERA